MKKENLSKEILLTSIYKHKALSVDQLKMLLGIKSRSTVACLITKYRKKELIKQLKTPTGVFYFLTNKGSKLINKNRVNVVSNIEKEHTSYEIKTIRHLIETNVIKPESYTELLNTYKTDRELKRIKFNELGGKAHKLRWVDLLVSTKNGLTAYEIEITKKNKDRYPPIITKLDTQFKDDEWIEIVWVVLRKDVKWFSEVIMKAGPTATHSLLPIDKLKG